MLDKIVASRRDLEGSRGRIGLQVSNIFPSVAWCITLPLRPLALEEEREKREMQGKMRKNERDCETRNAGKKWKGKGKGLSVRESVRKSERECMIR